MTAQPDALRRFEELLKVIIEGNRGAALHGVGWVGDSCEEKAKQAETELRAFVAELAKDRALRRACVECLKPLYFQLQGQTFGSGKTSADHLSWMCREILEKIDVMPVDKIGRWVGFFQGVMAASGALDVDAERERTRPIFNPQPK